jgi:hypothetical protein
MKKRIDRICIQIKGSLPTDFKRERNKSLLKRNMNNNRPAFARCSTIGVTRKIKLVILLLKHAAAVMCWKIRMLWVITGTIALL